MNLRTLDAHDIKVVCQCINDYGKYEVTAKSNNLADFPASVAKKCLGKAISNNFIRTDVKVLLRQIRDRITE
jgi:hypothetical protein